MSVPLKNSVQVFEEAQQQLYDLKERMKGFIDELDTMERSGDLGLVRERLGRWEQRVVETLREFGMQGEVERLRQVSGIGVIGDPYGNIAREVKAKKDVLICLIE